MTMPRQGAPCWGVMDHAWRDPSRALMRESVMSRLPIRVTHGRFPHAVPWSHRNADDSFPSTLTVVVIVLKASPVFPVVRRNTSSSYHSWNPGSRAVFCSNYCVSVTVSTRLSDRTTLGG